MSLFDDGLVGIDADPETYLAEDEEAVATWYPERPELVIAVQGALRLVGRLDDDRGLSTRLALGEVTEVEVETERSLPAYVGVRLAVVLGATMLVARALSVIQPQVAIIGGALAVAILAASVVVARRSPSGTTVVLRTADGGQREIRFRDDDEGESLATHVEAFRES